MRVVFSIDLTSTFVFGVMGELASFSGLKLRTELMIRLDVLGRVRIRIERQFRVASTSRASLWESQPARLWFTRIAAAYLLLSCNTPSILSKSPVASASRCMGSNKGWFGGIMLRDISSPLY